MKKFLACDRADDFVALMVFTKIASFFQAVCGFLHISGFVNNMNKGRFL
jgi:hypothetical protein